MTRASAVGDAMMRRLMFLALLLLSACAAVDPSVDPYEVAGQAQMTANAANEQADYYSMIMTVTAEAPIIEITQTAAAMSVLQTQVSMGYTSTAMSWTPTPAPTATPNATATIAAEEINLQKTQMANEAQLSDLQVERARSVNTLRAASVYVVGFVALLCVTMLWFVYVRRLSMMPTPIHDATGRPVPMINVVDGSWVNLDRAANGGVALSRNYIDKLPALTAERQDANMTQARMLEAPVRGGRSVQRNAVAALAEPQPVDNALEYFLLPSWELVNGWDGKRGLPYYTARGLEIIDTDQYPHLSVIGMTGMGKSRRFFRPLIACALAAGHKVVIIGKSADYWPFESHPNATLVKISQVTRPEQAERYGAILQNIVNEMNRRDDILTANRKSTWTHAGGCRTFVVLDELGNALRLMDPQLSRQARLWVEGLVMEGRKAGFSLLLANQRATGMASILSQTGKAIFRVERDEERAHKSLAGASDLRDGYFLARFGGGRLAGAFEPSDAEISAFLASRPVAELDRDSWIDGQLVEQDQVAAGDEASGLLPDNGGLHVDDIRKVIALLDEGESPSAVVRRLWGATGGSKFLRLNEQVKHIFEGMKGEAA